MDDLTVSRSLLIPAAELQWRFDTSGGPGGQHANRSATRVEVSVDIAGSPSIEEGIRARLIRALGDRLQDGRVVVQVNESRSQWRNRQIARRRLVALLADAMRPPAPTRRPTKPSRAARERRLTEKRARSETKRLRRRPPETD